MAAADQPATRNQSSPSVSESQELPVQEQGGGIKRYLRGFTFNDN